MKKQMLAASFEMWETTFLVVLSLLCPASLRVWWWGGGGDADNEADAGS